MSDESLTIKKEEQRAYWTMHIQRWKESNMTQEAYCTQAGVSYGSFVHWKSALFPKPKIGKNKTFVPLKVDATQSISALPSQTIQIKLTTGHIAYLPAAMDLKQIAALIYHLGRPHA